MYYDETKINEHFDNIFLNKEKNAEKDSYEDDNIFSNPSSDYIGRFDYSLNYFEYNKKPFDLNFEPVLSFNESLFKQKIFNVVYREREEENDYPLIEKEIFKKRKRNPENSKTKTRRRENRDNIRKKIKRAFFNRFLIPKINTLLRNKDIDSSFANFQNAFVINVNKKTNKELKDMTIKKIFEKKELYQEYKESELKYYNHNLKLVKTEEILEIKELKNILNKTYQEIFEEYLNSKEFKINEINRLKKKFEDDYIKKYIYLAKHFIEFISE
jgi:hypothetical protein